MTSDNSSNSNNTPDTPNEGILDFNLDDTLFTDTNSSPEDLSDPFLRQEDDYQNLDKNPGEQEEEDDSGNPDPVKDQDKGGQEEDESDDEQEEEEEQEESEEEEEGEDFDDYTSSALLAEALKEEGLALFEDVDKELSSEKLVGGIRGFIDNSVDQGINEALKRFGQHAKYLRFMDQGGNPEDIKPAIQSQKYAQFNPDDPNVTEDQLKDVVKAMYLKKGADEQTADDMVEVDVEKGRLKERAGTSVKFHGDFVTNVEKQALRNYQLEQERQQRAIQEESQNFANTLRSGKILNIPIDNDTAAAIFDSMYSRNQVINYTDQDGAAKKEMLTRYEIGMHRAVNDPEKLAFLNYLILNDFDLSGLVGVQKAESNSKIKAALDRKQNTRKRKSGGKKQTPRDSGEILMEFDV